MTTRAFVALLLGGFCGWAVGQSVASPALAGQLGAPDFRSDVQPIVAQYCYACHGAEKQKAGVSLHGYRSLDEARNARDVWAKVLRVLTHREMPPEGKPQPDAAERDRLMSWIRTGLFPLDCEHADPGRVTLRRLNRAEYNNTIRDLVGIEFQPAEDFPADDSGYGFDNIGDVLSLSPLLLEKYLAAAERILDAALVTPELHRRIILCEPRTGERTECSRSIIRSFARRAFRRPPTEAEVERLVALATSARKAGESFEGSVTLALEAILVSPSFLFRGEVQPEPDNPQAVHPINEHALASRLSYFLWSSLPDEELCRLADEGRLRANLEPQVRRLLRDPKATALVENFGGQWLQTRNLALVSPDVGKFPAFTAALRAAMRRETDLLFAHILQEDRSVLEFLTADYTFVDQRLATFYGLPGIRGDRFRRVALAGTPRGGVLTHASVLTITSNPTRTSPVKRGKWVLENLLNAPPPPPPPNVPVLKEGKEDAAAGTLRQRMEQHRADPACASCHALMDPIGFGLENFDGIGAWRDQEGGHSIDPAGTLNTGEAFAGAAELRRLLATAKRDPFVRCLAEKLLTYALGRGLEYYDQCAVDRIVQNLARAEYRFSALVLEIVDSAPFQMRRGEGDRLVPRL